MQLCWSRFNDSLLSVIIPLLLLEPEAPRGARMCSYRFLQKSLLEAGFTAGFPAIESSASTLTFTALRRGASRDLVTQDKALAVHTSHSSAFVERSQLFVNDLCSANFDILDCGCCGVFALQ